MFSRLVGYAAAQRRKANIGIFYTVQSWDWVYKRLRQLTHLVTLCFDLYWTPWGKDVGIARGEQLRLTTYDCKGFFTGHPWSMIGQKTLNAKALRPYFDSFATVDLFEGMKKFEVKRPTEIFDLRGGGDEDQDDSPFSKEPGMADLTRAADDESLMHEIAGNLNPKLAAKLQRRLNRE